MKLSARGSTASSRSDSAPNAPAPVLSSFSRLIMTLIAAAVRHAITQEPKQAARILTLFKQMLPKTLAALEM